MMICKLNITLIAQHRTSESGTTIGGYLSCVKFLMMFKLGFEKDVGPNITLFEFKVCKAEKFAN